MTEYEVKLVVGSLLHDIGKVIFSQEKKNHSECGYEFLKSETGIQDEGVLECVRFHHRTAIEMAPIAENAMCYLVFMADNIAASIERRKKDSGNTEEEMYLPMQSVFNILNGNDQKFYYEPGILQSQGEIHYPREQKITPGRELYDIIQDRIAKNLNEVKWNNEYVNSLLELLEENLAFIPATMEKEEISDISLYDHVKMTAAIASCIDQYLNESADKNLKRILQDEEDSFYKQEVFLLFSMDISGIQKFIYTIVTENALRTLRARSFYLEIVMEHIIDCLLEKLHLSRANLIYSGGGHCYMLLPNVESVKNIVTEYLADVNQWFLRNFGVSLYIAGAYEPCSSMVLKNQPEGSYAQLFRNVGGKISRIKMNRYSASDIIKLNSQKKKDYTRECRVCKEIGKVDEDGICDMCKKIEKLSQKVLYGEFFSILREGVQSGLPMPGGYVLVGDSTESLRKRMEKDADFVRTYAKNKSFNGVHTPTRLWIGDYTTGQTFEDFAEKSCGIKRIGVIRADVDNLGHAFVSGFDNEKNHNKYVTLSRTATLSRQLTLFFKLYIRDILEHGQFSLQNEKKDCARMATIVYSGGDDVFIVGCWYDVIELAVDLKSKFEKYTQGTLSLSAGIGIYNHRYPISVIAEETGDMEASSKAKPGKNSVTVMEDGKFHTEDGVWISDGTYSWDEFEQEVVGEKLQALIMFLENSESQGMSFLYHLLELIRNQGEKINFARMVYFLSRMEPLQKGEHRQRYQEFSQKMLQWVRSEKDCRQLKTAIQLYAYLHRRREDGENDY